MFNNSQLTFLKAQIKQLKQENTLLRLYLRDIINTAHQAINSELEKEEKDLELGKDKETPEPEKEPKEKSCITPDCSGCPNCCGAYLNMGEPEKKPKKEVKHE